MKLLQKHSLKSPPWASTSVYPVLSRTDSVASPPGGGQASDLLDFLSHRNQLTSRSSHKRGRAVGFSLLLSPSTAAKSPSPPAVVDTGLPDLFRFCSPLRLLRLPPFHLLQALPHVACFSNARLTMSLIYQDLCKQLAHVVSTDRHGACAGRWK